MASQGLGRTAQIRINLISNSFWPNAS